MERATSSGAGKATAGTGPAAGSGPPAAPQARTYCVGITGHRPKGLAHADLPVLCNRIRNCLQLVRELLTRRLGVRPAMAFVSPLSEGADRYGAEQALALGYFLITPLPFARDEFSNDFTAPGSRGEFQRLLASASEVLELPGTRDAETAAYMAAGRAVLDRSDVLLTVWDGAEARGDGGTGQITLEAIHRHIPTIWIHSQAPHKVCLLVEDPRHGGVREERLSRLSYRLRRLSSA